MELQLEPGEGISRKDRKIQFNKLGKILLTLLKWYCLYMALGYGAYGLSSDYNALALIFCFFMLVLIFRIIHIRLKGMSLPIYLEN